MSASQTARALSLGDLITMTFDLAEGLHLDAQTTARVVQGAVERLLRSRARRVGGRGARSRASTR